MTPTTERNPEQGIVPGPAERLAVQLTALLPGAVVVHVRLQGPRTLWPHLRLTVEDEGGRTLRVPRARAVTLARWIIRSFPQAKWAATGHAFDLRTATLRGLEA
ncbi:transcriptional regulator [Streptomyces goshikiensis]|uniref:transcriptional regulator n=1 Tax=Streptomyces goshikiensis TaxID=1942 RepID=UPI00366A3F7E